MNERTITYTVEVTTIVKDAGASVNEIVARQVERIQADDAHVRNVKVFERND